MKDKLRDKIEIIVFIIFISFFGLGYVFFRQREFSEMENRYLNLCPEFTWKTFLSGEFSEDFEEYTADQILGKDLFMKTNVAMNRSLGISEINQVFSGKDGYLIQDYQEPDSIFDGNLTYIRRFAERNPEVDMAMLIVPNSCEIYPEMLPDFAETYQQSIVIGRIQASLGDRITVVDATESLMEHKDEVVFYKTDHHWTSLGAYYGYEELCEAMELPPTSMEQYNRLTLSEPFYGSLYSKSPGFQQESDQVSVFYRPDGEYVVSVPSENRVEFSMFHMEYAGRKDKYAVFFGGNYPLTIIESNSNNTEKVLIIKDSYANCLVPMLADNYKEIHMVDLRYYHEDLTEYLQEQDIKTVIFIHNIDFISTDNNFLWL